MKMMVLSIVNGALGRVPKGLVIEKDLIMIKKGTNKHIYNTVKDYMIYKHLLLAEH